MTPRPFTIALSGKGGTGKTTISSLLVRAFIDAGECPVLAVDADPNANFHEALGVEVKETLGRMREEAFTRNIPPGMNRHDYVRFRFRQALVESNGFDLIAMGRPEGPGCYCAANNLLGSLIDRLIGNYRFIVIDNEAGMEHFSRLTQKHIDLLILVSDPSRRGLSTACRIAGLVKDLPMRVSRTVLVVNQVREKPESWPEDVRLVFGKENISCLPSDPLVSKFDLEGEPTLMLPGDAPVVKAAEELFDGIFCKTG